MNNFDENKLLESIVFNTYQDLLNSVLVNKQSIKSDYILLGFSHSGYEFRNHLVTKNYNHINKNCKWIHALAFCTEPKAEEILSQIFLTEPLFKGDCLLALWFRKSVLFRRWIYEFYSFDPDFKSLAINHSPFVTDLCKKHSVHESELFIKLFFLENEKDDVDPGHQQSIRESIIKDVLVTGSDLEKEDESGSKSQEFNKSSYYTDKRRKLIQSGTLNQVEADKIFNKLWKSNVSNIEKANRDFFDLTPNRVFNIITDSESGIHYKYGQEIKQLYSLIPLISESNMEKIFSIYESLPYWAEPQKPILKYVYEKNPNRVIEDSKKILIKDLELGDYKKTASRTQGPWINKTHRGREFPFRPVEQEIANLMELILNDLELTFLVKFVNHYSELVRKIVQRGIEAKST